MNTRFAFTRLVSACILTAGLTMVASAAPAPAPVVRFDEKKAIAYRITRGDRLSVSVFDEPLCTVGGKRVEARGIINLPLIQEIRVAGLTISEAQTAIEKTYKEGRFIRNRQVTITVEEYAPRTVSLTGKVNSPARYELPPEQIFTLKDLILKAGGFAETAKGTDVRVTRTMPDGTLKLFDHLDVDSVIKGKKNATSADAAFVLEPDDVVYVPERLI